MTAPASLRRRRPLLSAAVPVLLLVLLWQVADGPGALARLAVADPRWLLLAVLAVTAQTVLSALRWRLVAAAMGVPLQRQVAVREYFVAQVVNQTLPGGVLGDVARAVRAGQAGLRPAAESVVAERAAGQAAVFALLLPALSVALLIPGGIDGPRGTAGIVVLGWIAALLVGMALRAGLRRGIGPLCRCLAALTAPGHRGRIIALSGAILTLNLLAFAAAARATGTALPPSAIVTLVPLILTAMLVPLSIGGWGWREGASSLLFPLAGATAAGGLAASATFGLCVLAAALPGVIWLMRPRRATIL